MTGIPKSRKNRPTQPEAPATLAPAVRSVFDTLGRSIAWHIRDLHRLFTSHLQSLVSREGAAVGHWYYLRVLAEQNGLTQLELSRRVGLAATTSVPALDNMEKQGLVKRVRDTEDRRRSFVFITDKGRALLDELMPSITALLEHAVTGVSERDLKTFQKVLVQIQENLSTAAPELTDVND
ncbi:MarR family winged helix-turn-helix transcriptional regulator [Cupriavidus basilensis]|uniref:MarR family winged helix-turn-helix transcriptional regulator n=1 Tax=Cupriavidus basilensis TaxID=68895 RepID=UPI0009DA94F8|nr:MarR family winged helix-turn-helix transcriptional regulator [Cupriavidus basilensis]